MTHSGLVQIAKAAAVLAVLGSVVATGLKVTQINARIIAEQAGDINTMSYAQAQQAGMIFTTPVRWSETQRGLGAHRGSVRPAGAAPRVVLAAERMPTRSSL